MAVQDPIDRYASRRSTVYANNGIVATSQPLASQTGLKVLREGGNAFDAAVATAAVLTVVEPFNTGIGGDVFALYRTADGTVEGMRSCGRAPKETDIDELRDIYGSDSDPTLPDRAPHTVTPPGTGLGWEAICDNYGTCSFSELLQPAASYANNGFPVSEVIARQWRDTQDMLETENARDAFLVDGEAPDAGDEVRLPELGSTLEALAEHGSEVLYDGPIGEKIVKEVRSHGGALSEDDLSNVNVEWLDPVSTTYNGTDIYELPPNNQGLIALEALNIAEELDASEYPYLSTEATHRYVEALKLAFTDGHRYITDPEFEDRPPLASKSYAAERARNVTDSAAVEIEVGLPDTDTPHNGDTVLLTVADDEGNVVSLINSIFTPFGSGLVADDTGILLQNRGSSFSLDPDHPNSYAPGKRPFHTLIPAVAEFGPEDWAAFGVMGGFMQPQGHVQVVAGLVDYDLTLQEALDVPRWYYRESGRLSVESRMDEVLQTQLARRGHDVDVDTPDYFGGGQIARYDDGTLSGATDPRKDGTVASF